MGLSKQNVVVVNVAKTESGYSASCDLLDGWVVAVTGDWSDLEREVRDSIDFYIDCAKEDGDSYPEIFDRDYRIEYRCAKFTLFLSEYFFFFGLAVYYGNQSKAVGPLCCRQVQAEKEASRENRKRLT